MANVFVILKFTLLLLAAAATWATIRFNTKKSPVQEKKALPPPPRITYRYRYDLPTCRYVETILRRIRKDGNIRPINIPIEWQEKAMWLAPDAFELFLCEVWRTLGGDAAYDYRWEESPLRKLDTYIIPTHKEITT